jgi:myosin heavy subunit
MNTLIGEILNKCDLHFIRCVKSNNQKKPLYLDEEVVYNQICYLGILDTIKIKKMGYCIKI